MDFNETLSNDEKLATVRIVLSLVVTYRWPIHLVDINNAFLHDNLQELRHMGFQ